MKTIAYMRMLMMTCGVAALSAPAFAQSDAATPSADVESVVVTGSRIVRDGFQAPTPVTTLAADDLQNRAPTNIPDALNQLPQFRGSSSHTRSVTWNVNSPNQGNYLNLRNLGITRSLILLDGVRVPPTSYAGGVDVNILPQALVQRVDVVTGGASAAYGSDAVVGVVNFILDKNFTGIKGSVQAGTSKYNDGNSYKATVAAGTPFAGGRGHIEGSAEVLRSDPISNNQRANGNKQILRVGRTQNGISVRETFFGTRFSNLTDGGYILSGPLAGFQFLPGGAVARLQLGTSTGSNAYTVGGEGTFHRNTTLISELDTSQIFGRVSYDLTDKINVHAQMALAETANKLNPRIITNTANSVNQLTIFADNPFLNPTVRTALGTTPSFTMSRLDFDTELSRAKTLNDAQNYNIGLDGTFNAVGRDWKWDANYVYGRNYLRTRSSEFNMRRMFAAVDAGRDPTTGAIVCRANIVSPGSFPGCVPINFFGVGSPSQAAYDYVTWNSQYRAVNSMNIGAVNLSGDLFDMPAGPVSIAFGGEVRNQTLHLTSSSDPALAPAVAAGYNTIVRGVPAGALISSSTNIGIANGDVQVKEAYAELAIPLLKDLPFAQSLDLNLAGRITDYSTSGTVETWKVGLSYQPFNDLRLRTTVSRDIAAPTLYQLFQGPTVESNQGLDVHTGGTTVRITETRGNSSLAPEVGSVVVAGAVYSPSYLPGFTASIDGYSIYITGAIAATTAATLNDQCEASNGTADVCQFIFRPGPFSDRSLANSWTRVIQTNLNQSKVFQSGFDVEASYRFQLSDLVSSWPGALQLRGLASVVTANRAKVSATALTQNQLGVGNNPRIAGQIEANYINGPFSLRLSNRWTGKAKATLTSVDLNYPMEPNVSYTDVNVAYKFRNQELFLNVQNLFDTQPPLSPDGANPGFQFPTNRAKYDVMGRYYTVGIRFKM